MIISLELLDVMPDMISRNSGRRLPVGTDMELATGGTDPLPAIPAHGSHFLLNAGMTPGKAAGAVPVEPAVGPARAAWGETAAPFFGHARCGSACGHLFRRGGVHVRHVRDPVVQLEKPYCLYMPS
jgi:hypothetical protein